MTTTVRTATLYGTLVGPIWMPVVEGQLPITVDLRREAARYVNAAGSGLVDAIRAAVNSAGDFRSARLTSDSFVIIEHRRLGPPSGRVMSWSRRVNVADLPSLAEYVAAAEYAQGDD